LDFKNFIGQNQAAPVPNFTRETPTQTVPAQTLEQSVQVQTPSAQTLSEPVQVEQQADLAAKYFDLDEFVKELYIKTSTKNKENIQNQKYMSSYDVASSCISNILHKLKNTPIRSYANRWAPITLRGYLGNAVHHFIQENTNQFTEDEVSLKVPSIRFSGRIDDIVGNNVLVEIKSLPYKEYLKIIKTKTPRINDFYQTLSYKYILENHLHEAKSDTEVTRSPRPKQDKYNIEYIQFLYVAHDILAHDIESLDEAISIVDQVKKILNSKHNTFYFMTNLLLDLKNFDIKEHMDYIENKINRVNYYLDNNLDVAADDEFVDNTKCFFCLYSDVCKHR